jgi:predicted DNA-binding transcriptional regulator YafY
MADSQILRQWILVRTISAEGTAVSVKKLVELTGVCDKTIRRDLSDLQAAGFPLIETVGEYGRKSFSIDTTVLPQLSFAYDEALALYLCKQAMTPLVGTFFSSSAAHAFRKIEASLGKNARTYVEKMRGRVLQTGIPGDYADKGELLDQIMIGLEESKAVFVTYHSQRSTEPVTLDIFPYGVVEHRGAIYVIGYSRDHDEVRTWKLNRVVDAKTTDFPFKRPPDFKLENYLAGSLGIYHGDGEIIVRARFTPATAGYIAECGGDACAGFDRRRSVESSGTHFLAKL